MLSRTNIRGIVVIIAIIAVVALIALVGRVRRAHYIAERPTPTTEVKEEVRDSLFVFDPNTVSYEELRAMGFDKRTAVGIIKYRAAGKVFGIVEEVALCYGVTDSMYRRLKPYIRIGSKYATSPQRTLPREPSERRFAPHPTERFAIDTVGVEYLRKIGFSTRQARTLIDYRDRGEGIYDINELRDCYAVSREMADSLERYIIFTKRDPYKYMVEVNSADSARLVRLPGIGAKSASAIIQYRKFLGGYHHIEQILELKCVTPENFARFSKQIYCDSCKISKIDINFATALEMEYHPYMTRKAIKSIIALRESKGGWSNLAEMNEDDIFTKEQAIAIAPYLHFGTTPQRFK